MTVEVASDSATREYGLMNRTSLDQGSGMLFVFDVPQSLSFWMKNTLIPLDVLFFTPQGAFVSASAMTPCVADPCAVYTSGGPALYALEVNVGYVEAHGVGQGWKLSME